MRTKKKFIPYGRQWINYQDIRAVSRVLRSDWITQGPEIKRFEDRFARYCGAPYAVAVSSGTAGLHLACLAAGFKTGDEVITSPITFVATSNSILYCGAKPRFADIDKNTVGLTRESIKVNINSKTRGVILVHYAGQPSFCGNKRELCLRKDFVVIEDACHALGAEYLCGRNWRKIGSCMNSDMAVFSFHPVKHIATGEGGMITTRRKDLYEKLVRLRSHGIIREREKFVDRQAAKNPWYYEMSDLGFNYRITDIQCALGLSQMKRLGHFLKARRSIAEFYNKGFSGINYLTVPRNFQGTRSSYHLYVLRVDFDNLGINRREFMLRLAKQGIGSQVHYMPVFLHPYYRRMFKYNPASYPITAKFYDQCLSIPMYPGMSRRDVCSVIGAVRKLCKA